MTKSTDTPVASTVLPNFPGYIRAEAVGMVALRLFPTLIERWQTASSGELGGAK